MTNPGDSAVGEREREARNVAVVAAQNEFTREYIRRMKTPQFPSFAGAGEYLSFVTGRGEKLLQLEEEKLFTLDGDNLGTFQDLASYFTGDQLTWPCSLDFRKGLCVAGGYGCGKSIMMRLFGQNPRQSFRILSSRSLADDFRLNNDLSYLKAPFMNHCSAKFFGQSVLGLCIDDVGAESLVSSFGNLRNVVAEVIQDRSDNPQLRGPMTHIVTNATAVELREALGPRVYDRLRQMFNIVEFPQQPSRR